MKKRTEPNLEAGLFEKQDGIEPGHKARPGQVMPGMADVSVERMTGIFSASAPDKPTKKPKKKSKKKPAPKKKGKVKKKGKGKKK